MEASHDTTRGATELANSVPPSHRSRTKSRRIRDFAV
jgi:hypothetical protein